MLSFDAWRACRLVVDTGHARARLDAPPGDRVHARAHGARREQHRERGRPLHRVAGPGARLQDRPARDAAPARRGASGWAPAFDIRAFHDAVLGEGALGLDAAGDRRRVGRRATAPALSAAGAPRSRHPGRRGALARAAQRAYPAAGAGLDARLAADWALLVVALLVAYDAGGAALVGLVSLIRMVPATLVNVLVDPGRFARADRGARRAQPGPVAGRRPPSRSAVLLDVPCWCSRRSRAVAARPPSCGPR